MKCALLILTLMVMSGSSWAGEQEIYSDSKSNSIHSDKFHLGDTLVDVSESLGEIKDAVQDVPLQDQLHFSVMGEDTQGRHFVGSQFDLRF